MGQAPDISIEGIRQRVRDLVEAFDEGPIANAAGVGKQTLMRFLAGKAPSNGTRRRLFRLVLTSSVVGDQLAVQAIAGLFALIDAVPDGVQELALVQLLAVVRATFEKQEVACPGWLTRVIAALDGLCDPQQADDERIAALLDGRLSGIERELVLGAVADGDEEFRVFADSARLLREREAG